MKSCWKLSTALIAVALVGAGGSPALAQEVADQGVADESDLPLIREYALACDQLLIDAKPPRDATLPGGNGLAFDWRLVAQRRWLRPWMLAGGLTPDNVAEAVRLTSARQVDVSSGVESSPGVKDHFRIRAFLDALDAVP